MPELDVENQRIYYEVIGDGPHPVLLIPGFVGSIDTDFAPIFPSLNKTKFRWVCIDPPGYGRSRPQDFVFENRMYERCGVLAGKFMQKLGFEKYSVAGWSQGGAYAVKLAQNFPENVDKLIIWGTFATGNARGLKFHESMTNLDTWPQPRLNETLKTFDKEYLLSLCKNMVTHVKTSFPSVGDRYLDPLPDLTCPALILHGKRDALTDGSQPLAWKSTLKNSRIYYFQDGAHAIHLQFTAEFVKVIEEFLEE